MAEDTGTSSGESVYTEEEVTTEGEGEGQTEGNDIPRVPSLRVIKAEFARMSRREEGGLAAARGEREPHRRQCRVKRGGDNKRDERHFDFHLEEGREVEKGVRVERLPQQQRRGSRRHKK